MWYGPEFFYPVVHQHATQLWHAYLMTTLATSLVHAYLYNMYTPPSATQV